MKQFTIDEKYIVDETVRREWSIFEGIPPEKLTHEQLIKIIKGEDRMVSTNVRDHPEFDKLRDQLEAEGYIKTERSFWNGDVVVRPFMLNEWEFKTGQRFFCAVALRLSIKSARMRGRKSLDI